MFRVTAYYPYKSGGKFDFDYYKNTHVEIFRNAFGPAGIESLTLEKGVSGPEPDSTPTFTAVFHATFRDGRKFTELFAKNAGPVLADIPKFTDLSPSLQFGEVVFQK